MAYWLFKSEPHVWSWDMQKKAGSTGEEWSGVRNYQARNHMRAMLCGDLGFFYHSNTGKEIVGIIEVCREARPDSTSDDDRWDCVCIRAVCDLLKPVSLADVKSNPLLADMSLVTSARLSVQPVTAREWEIICVMGGIAPEVVSRGHGRTSSENGGLS